jgi:ABC-type nickel/cobalt efflux system permease component RcnA
MALIDLIPGMTQAKAAMAIGGAVVVLSFGAWIWWEVHEVGVLHKEVATLQQNNKVLQQNADVYAADFKTCQAANSTDSKTITDLMNERADAKTSVNILAAQQQSNARTINDLKSQLESMKKDPKNNGVLAPTLRETIRGIQASGRN